MLTLHHVQVSMPEGREDDARRFYRDALGLDEVATWLSYGASPRATLQLIRAAKVWAALDGREFVIPDDVATLVEPVFAHRIIAARTSPTARARSAADTISAILRSIVGAVRVPLATR